MYILFSSISMWNIYISITGKKRKTLQFWVKISIKSLTHIWFNRSFLNFEILINLWICVYVCTSTKAWATLNNLLESLLMMCWSQRLNLLSLPLAASTFISDEPSYQLSVFHLLILFSYTKVNITSTIVEGYENYPNLTNT